MLYTASFFSSYLFIRSICTKKEIVQRSYDGKKANRNLVAILNKQTFFYIDVLFFP